MPNNPGCRSKQLRMCKLNGKDFVLGQWFVTLSYLVCHTSIFGVSHFHIRCVTLPVPYLACSLPDLYLFGESHSHIYYLVVSTFTSVFLF